MSGDINFRGQRRKRPEEAAADTDVAAGEALFARSGAGSDRRLREAEILAAIDQVPALSSVVHQILSLAGSQRSSAADLESLVSRDLVITGRLLKLVNSPFYALANDVHSITQAVAIVGMNSLRSLVVAASVSSMLMVDLRSYGFEDEGLWQNSIAAASLARRIALQTHEDKNEAEDAFIAGLMRRVGILVLGPILARFEVNLVNGPCEIEDHIQLKERQYIGYDHVWVALRLTERWNLPSKLAQLIASDKSSRVPERRWMQAVLTLAERLANNNNIGLVPDHSFPRGISSKLVSQAGLDTAGFRVLVEQLPEVIEAARMDMG